MSTFLAKWREEKVAFGARAGRSLRFPESPVFIPALSVSVSLQETALPLYHHSRSSIFLNWLFRISHVCYSVGKNHLLAQVPLSEVAAGSNFVPIRSSTKVYSFLFSSFYFFFFLIICAVTLCFLFVFVWFIFEKQIVWNHGLNIFF